jgi:hypothetical protein
MNKDKVLWVSCLRTIKDWSKYIGTGYSEQVMLQVGLLDQYTELVILSKILGRKIPSWVVGKI